MTQTRPEPTRWQKSFRAWTLLIPFLSSPHTDRVGWVRGDWSFAASELSSASCKTLFTHLPNSRSNISYSWRWVSPSLVRCVLSLVPAIQFTIILPYRFFHSRIRFKFLYYYMLIQLNSSFSDHSIYAIETWRFSIYLWIIGFPRQPTPPCLNSVPFFTWFLFRVSFQSLVHKTLANSIWFACCLLYCEADTWGFDVWKFHTFSHCHLAPVCT